MLISQSNDIDQQAGSLNQVGQAQPNLGIPASCNNSQVVAVRMTVSWEVDIQTSLPPTI